MDHVSFDLIGAYPGNGRVHGVFSFETRSEPQLADDGSPYCFWGPEPSFFDAPSTTDRLELWSTHAFLVASPDAVMTKEVRAVCGFSWGFTNSGSVPEAEELLPIGDEAWSVACAVLAGRYPAWRFGPGGTRDDSERRRSATHYFNRQGYFFWYAS